MSNTNLSLPNTVNTSSLSFCILAGLCILYAFSHPYPQNISYLEILIGFLLGIAFFLNLLQIKNIITSWILIFILGSVIFWPLFVGILQGATIGNIIRDIIPGMYIVFACSFLIRSYDTSLFLNKIYAIIPYLICFIGLCYSIREIYPYLDQIISQRGVVWLEEHLLIQSSAVTFTMCFFLLRGCNFIYERKKIKGLIFLIISFIPFLSTYLAVMRAPLAFYLITIFVAFFIWPSSAVNKIFLVSIITFFGFFILSSNSISPYLSNLIDKQKNHGNNGKIEEVIKISDQTLISSPTIQILGRGWGSSWVTPALSFPTYPGKKIGFAHSFIAYSVLKFGFTGYLVSALFLGLILYLFISTCFKINLFSYSGSFLISTIPPLIIGFFLEPNFKTLDFSLVLLALVIVYKVNKSKRENLTISSIKRVDLQLQNE